ncbi:type II toxin-antitoxin system Phd/YefM family antitoxin [Planomonospora sp. ID82291]|uniref:type II toxin-antitoxin system Phd/YefM family antitoxin n=1 Tax=Planomonospora sp. ID82291 TaxID=2738136 RepID=UPI0018C36194|nr:type II toxin-antitoxin system Phd/YefM family antitoxin [Planomonospora sp. ID82291]MBG0816938.1 type II toxin-antitoxin system Phd/YefM family antitoxin [Planomonospora sp. ID82291]
MAKFLQVEPLASARAQLSETIARISEQGVQAEPVVIGRRRKAEAVLISFELYERLADLIDEIQLAPLLRERLAGVTESPDLTLEEVADSLGIDLEEPLAPRPDGHESVA